MLPSLLHYYLIVATELPKEGLAHTRFCIRTSDHHLLFLGGEMTIAPGTSPPLSIYQFFKLENYASL